jgi:S1-C subfamily serine protease
MTDETKGINLPEFSASLARLIDGVSPSVVEVHSGRRAAASGFVWRQGLVVTADEALGGHKTADVVLAGDRREAAIVGRDPSTDIAVLRVDGLTAPPLTLSLDAPPRTGELVLAAGKREQGASARLGIVSLTGGSWRSMRGGHIDTLIQLDLALDRRGEGGPLIDSKGRAFGMAVRGPRRSVLAIPAATIERIGARIVAMGSIRPGYLGLGLHPVRIHEQGAGLIVLGLSAGGPGHAAGILQGDIITRWNGETLTGMRDVLRRLGPDSTGETVELGLLRAGQAATVRCVIGARPEA